MKKKWSRILRIKKLEKWGLKVTNVEGMGFYGLENGGKGV